jgi:hypothetical protein
MGYNLDRWEDFDIYAQNYIEDSCDNVITEAINHAAYQMQMPLDDSDQSYTVHDLRPMQIEAQLSLCSLQQLSDIQNKIFDLINNIR